MKKRRLILGHCIAQAPAGICTKSRDRMHGRQHVRVFRTLSQLKAPLGDLDGPQRLAARPVRLPEIDEPAKVLLGLTKFLTEFTNSLDCPESLVRGETVLDRQNSLLSGAQCKIDSHTMGIIRQSFE